MLKDVVSRPESFSGEVLLRIRRRLGVSEVVAGGMHLDVYQSAIQASEQLDFFKVFSYLKGVGDVKDVLLLLLQAVLGQHS